MGDHQGYFVQYGSQKHSAPAAVAGREHLGNDHGPRPRRRRKRQIARPIGIVLGVAAVGFFAWAQIAPESAANHDIAGVIAKAKSAVENASTDPSLKRAALYYDQQYEVTGSYPVLSEDAQHDDPNTNFGVGVTVLWCTRNAVVLQSMTGAGSLSRLLLNGNEVGDVLGEHQCPADLSNPLPWKLPSASSPSST
jgi:hypothetical protein